MDIAAYLATLEIQTKLFIYYVKFGMVNLLQVRFICSGYWINDSRFQTLICKVNKNLHIACLDKM